MGRVKISKGCMDVLEYMIQHPFDQEWSAKIIDSMATFPVGILSSTTTQLGDFDQCLSVSGDFNGQHFVGKYCLATVNLPRKNLYEKIKFNSNLEPAWIQKYVKQWYVLDNKYPIASGVCFPSICDSKEIEHAIQTYYPILESFEFNLSYCQSVDEPPKCDPRLSIVLTILAIPLALMAVAFVQEIVFENKPNLLILKMISCFDPITNIQTLFHISDTTTNENKLQDNAIQFQFAHGIRALGSVFIVSGHVFGLLAPTVLFVNAYARFPTDFRALARRGFAQPFFNGGLMVHTFFVLSGMFLTYGGLSRKLKHNFIPFVLLRWFRYTPAVVGMICMTIALVLFGSGPLWHHDHLYLNLGGCYDYWWTHLLYVNNIVPIEHQCSLQTWYLGAEMQLHMLAFVFLWAYTKSSSKSYLVSFMFIALQFLVLVYVLLTDWARPTLLQYYAFIEHPFPQLIYNLRVLYMFPFNHLVPFFTGAIIGQLLLEKKIVHFSKLVKQTGFVASFGVIVYMLTHTYTVMNIASPQYTQSASLETAISVFVFTCLWSLANGWIIYQCAIDPQNVVARFLLAKIFQPFSRISFCLYLVHFMTLWFNVFQARSTISLAGLNGLWQLISSTILQSYILAFFLYLTFEAPGVKMMKLFLHQNIPEKQVYSEIDDKKENDEMFEELEIDSINNNIDIQKKLD